MRRFLDVAKAVSDESRARALLALRGGELCVCRLNELLGLAPSTVSKHMTILERAGLVQCRKDGRWHYYRLAAEPDAASPDARRGLDWLMASLRAGTTARQDRARLKAILAREKERVMLMKSEPCACRPK
jgi:DNA-binding transcriptional ArsR family regulator